MPVTPKLAALDQGQIEAINQIAGHKKIRRRESVRLNIDQSKRALDVFSGQEIVIPLYTAKADASLFTGCLGYLNNVVRAMDGQFNIQMLPKYHLHLAHLDAASLSATMDYLEQQPHFCSLLTEVAKRFFGPKAPLINSPSGMVPDIQTLIKYSPPLRDAVCASAQVAENLWAEVYRRAKLTRILAWPLNSVGEFLIRNLDPRWTDQSVQDGLISQEKLSFLAWTLLGRALAPAQTDPNNYLDWAQQQPRLLSANSENGVMQLPAEDMSRINSFLKAASAEYDSALQQILPNGLGLDMGGYLASGGIYYGYTAEPGSLMGLLAERTPNMSPQERLKSAARLLQLSVNKGILPPHFNHASALFADCGLSIDRAGQVLPLHIKIPVYKSVTGRPVVAP